MYILFLSYSVLLKTIFFNSNYLVKCVFDFYKIIGIIIN